MNNQRNGIWIAYVLSLLTPFTVLISGVIAMIYVGYRLDKDEDGDIANTHYYGMIHNFFLFLTFFVVLIVTVATSNGVLMGVSDYWVRDSTRVEDIAVAIPYVGAFIAAIAILFWLYRMIQGMRLLSQNLPQKTIHGVNL
ncbi:hypothetical protein [Vibrio sp.]|uniref:hypothetical protein n=1 Tax=Vibrio sp. TaxID=678 RepID=UPI003D1436C4